MIDKFHFNSELTKETYVSYLPNIKGDVLPITLSSIQDHRNERNHKLGEVLTIGYIGRKEPYKGIDLLIDALTKLHQENINFECLLYGDDFSKYDLMLDGHVKNMGTYKNSDIKSVFDSMDLLIIPSIWKETFGFIGLEALSYGVPVLFSRNVGSKDLISKVQLNYIFDNSQIFETLLHTIQNSSFLSDYFSIISELHILSCMEEHIQDIFNIYK